MKVTVTQPVEIEVSHIRITLPVRYADEDIPMDAPMRVGDVWSVVVALDTGIIDNWPACGPLDLQMKVRDEGVYVLLSPFSEELARIEDYVPHGVVPGRYGDYVELDIDATGRITNWPNKPDVSAFFKREDD